MLALRSAVVICAVVAALGCRREAGGRVWSVPPAKAGAAVGFGHRAAAGIGSPACGSCHKTQHAQWSYGSHGQLECAACHGGPAGHGIRDANPRPKMSTGSRGLCLECHDLGMKQSGKAMTPDELIEAHLKFLEKKHIIRIDRKRVAGRCIHCHDPHMGR